MKKLIDTERKPGVLSRPLDSVFSVLYFLDTIVPPLSVFLCREESRRSGKYPEEENESSES